MLRGNRPRSPVARQLEYDGGIVAEALVERPPKRALSPRCCSVVLDCTRRLQDSQPGGEAVSLIPVVEDVERHFCGRSSRSFSLGVV